MDANVTPDRIETLQAYIPCADGRHVFLWSPHLPGGSIDYAAPPGLRCQCGAVEYAGEPRQVAHFRGQGDSTGRPGREAGKPGNSEQEVTK